MKYLLFLLFILPLISFSQTHENLLSMEPDTTYENIHVKRITGTNKSTNFVIWIKNGVKLHKHEHHAETVYIFQGEGDMILGSDSIHVKTGDLIYIPENTPHSVKVTSNIPMKVLSVQAPEFLGKDRIFIE